MKSFTLPFILILSLFITFFSCSNKSSKSRKPVCSITITPEKRNYVYGEKVALNVKTKIKDGSISSIKLYYNGRILKESRELDFTVSGIELNNVGDAGFLAEAEKTDGQKNNRSARIEVVSDKVPEKFTYQVVNSYPHSTKHYTQGLEFVNNTLYESTGEYGTSGIFKTNFEKGNIEKSIFLDKEYFGEGITILNDKIYQLTYKNQKGFIYKLDDFSQIGTFQYPSKEGWGLTNDGTYLIMSDGTHILTWIDPVNFKVVKTNQVANNLGIINNLNELEYIDGIIYANIYTTNLIVQIDANTGKIIGEINLSAILDMYKNTVDPVDVLNGIAFQKKSNRLFVTGKYWPKIFEIKLISSK